MTFEEILDQAIAMLQRRGRLTYGTLQRQFQLDDAALAALKDELLYSQPHVVDDAGRGLVWTGATGTTPDLSPSPPPPMSAESPQGQTVQVAPPPGAPRSADAERRQLTVLFCDLGDSTALAGQLDPEDLREVIRAYQTTCATVIEHLDGHIAQYLGDGLLVYFGYPQAHEDDAHRAVRAGLGVVAAMQALNTHLAQRQGVRIAVRVGIHTGLVVVGAVGSGSRQEQLALGDTPNMAARLQGLATPDTVVLSAATFHLVQGYFAYQDLGTHLLKGVAAPVPVYRMLGESGVQGRLEATVPSRLTPLVGREEDVALLQQRWEQAKAELGQVVFLSGEAGIGKSRLVQVLKDHVAHEPHARIEWRGSSYHQQSALYPVMVHLHRLLRWQEQETPQEKLRMLETTLAASGLVLLEVVPLLAALLSLPPPEHYPSLTLTPQRQRQKTLEALLTWLYAESRRQPVLVIVEDLHWIDPSTLELLSLLIDQGASARLCLVLTARPEFRPPWAMVAHLTSLTLRRFAPVQVMRLATHVAGDKALPPAVLEEVVRKTDGVPLFVEELTKVVLESGLLLEQEDHYELTGPLPPLAIPATLHDALMARLDRLAAAKLVAQLGAAIGRTFAYDLVQAVAPLNEATLQEALAQLVEAELVAQRGMPPQATYMFKHALIQDAAYQSLLRSTRQQYHQRIAQILVDRFPETAATQPELVAQHYTEAGLSAEAIPYWQRAGQRALERSAHREALRHLTAGLGLLDSLPDTPEHTSQELDMQLALGLVWRFTKGYTAPEVAQTYARARVLCQQVGDSPQLAQILYGLWSFSILRAEHRTAQELGEQFLSLAQRQQDVDLLLEAHRMLAATCFYVGEFTATRTHIEQGLARYDAQQHHSHAERYGLDPGMVCTVYAASILWCLGQPEQARQRMQAALILAQERAHPHSLATVLYHSGQLHVWLREPARAQAWAEQAMHLATEQGFPQWVAAATVTQGWALATQGQSAEGIAQMHQGLSTWRALGAALWRPWWLAVQAEAYGNAGRAEVGLPLLAEALEYMDATGEHWSEAELYRLKGVLLLQQAIPETSQAEACFHQALTVARYQQAKSWELRAAMSLARLWQQQGKHVEAHDLLAPLYHWFTEGFDTADLQEAKTLLEALT